MANTLEEAFVEQEANVAAGKFDRFAVLNPAFKAVADHWSSTAGAIVNRETDEPCEHKCVWNEAGEILLCKHCFVDGT